MCLLSFGVLDIINLRMLTIDIFEVMPGHEMPSLTTATTTPVKAFMSTSLQISPGVPKHQHRPFNGRELNSSYNW